MNPCQGQVLPEKLPGFFTTPSTRRECRPWMIRQGHDTAVLMIHGFTGSPADFATFARPYAHGGMDVFAPLWPGHGAAMADLDGLSFLELFSPFVALIRHLHRCYATCHVLGLSYGGVLASRLCLDEGADSLCLLAPAFFLDLASERKIALVRRLRLYRLQTRKSKMPNDALPPHVAPYPLNFAYPKVPLLPACELHRETRTVRLNMHRLSIPLIHFHGDLDATTPLARNRDFLARTCPRYTFRAVPKGQHVLCLSPDAKHIAKQHLSWIKTGTI